MNHALTAWRSGEPRWDDGDLTPEGAQSAAQALRERVDGLETVLGAEKPARAAALRAKYAPLYYDLHRAELLADPATFDRRRTEHATTRALAQELAGRAIPTLSEALDQLGTSAPKDDIAREYMLWRHSLLPAPMEQWQWGEPYGHQQEFGLQPVPMNADNCVALDEGLWRMFGNHTRAPQLARLDAFQDAPGLPVRWLGSKGGDIAVALSEDEGRLHHPLAEAVSHSLVGRNLQPALERFNDWMQQRVENGVDTQRELSAHGRAMGDHLRRAANGRFGDYRHEFAHTLAHSVFNGPAMDPMDANAPTGHTVAAAANVMGVRPVAAPEDFRAGIGGME